MTLGVPRRMRGETAGWRLPATPQSAPHRRHYSFPLPYAEHTTVRAGPNRKSRIDNRSQSSVRSKANSRPGPSGWPADNPHVALAVGQRGRKSGSRAPRRHGYL